jgi:hypothetical protein
MPLPKPLTPGDAKDSLLHRLGSRVDRIRQFSTKFGNRPYRVFLVWTKYSGSERGEGTESEYKRIELLPTPKTMSMDHLTLNPMLVGVAPQGIVKLEEVSTTYTEDQLTGRNVPVTHADHVPEAYDFFYEIVEDGRGDPLPVRTMYRIYSPPVRRPGKVDWLILLERMSEDRTRSGQSQIGSDDFPGRR